MRVLITVLYVLGFLMLVEGFRRLLLQNREVTAALQWAARAESGAAPPDEEIEWLFASNQSLWGPAAARWVAKALEIMRQAQTTGAIVALVGGLMGLAATLLTLWAF